MTLIIPSSTPEMRNAQYRFEKGELTRVTKGVYVPVDSDPEKEILKNPMRIAAGLYPEFRLVGESAILRGMNDDNEVFVSARSKIRTREVGPLFIHRELEFSADFERISIQENGASLNIAVSTPELAVLEFLEGFGTGSPAVLRAGIDRLDRIHGSRERTIATLINEAERLGMGNRREKIQNALIDKEITPMTEEFNVFWYNSIIGKVGFDGARYFWTGRDGWVIPFHHSGRSLPPFLANLREEGALKRIRQATDIEVLRQGGRFLSNISIATPGTGPVFQCPDTLLERLRDNVKATASGDFFSGGIDKSLAGLVGSLEYGDSCVGEIAEMIEGQNLPTISGAQYKAAVALLPNGNVAAAGIDGNPFSHILKLAPANDRHLGFNEYVCMQACKAAGLQVADVAMVDLPAVNGQRQTGLLVERYDVAAHNAVDDRYFQIDCCAQQGLSPEQKGEGSWETIAKLLDAETTNPAEEKRQLFIRAVASWLIGDADAHLKNFSILRSCQHDVFGYTDGSFGKTTMSPAYDITSSVTLVSKPHFCLSLNNKHRDLKRADFRAFGSKCGLSRADADALLEETGQKCSAYVHNVADQPGYAPEQTLFLDLLTKNLDTRMNELKIPEPTAEIVKSMPSSNNSDLTNADRDFPQPELLDSSL